ncbi:hypothetical protein KC19_5G103000 [Ceratodon purpureus]|uniref:Uncharacterized protein n=1 Tax=Ceratodon purpureus TaxID=3225 RepID=A0A8T0I1D0_CERPU|nr:hypothetical protein KC19_5G103000 [Ceratodon purpureus]
MNHFYHNAFQKRRRSSYRVTCALSSTISLRSALGILVMTIISEWLIHSKHLQSCFERFIRCGLMRRYQIWPCLLH